MPSRRTLSISDRLHDEAERLAALLPSHWARLFLRAGAALIGPGAASVYRQRSTDRYLTRAEARRRPAAERALLERRPIAADFWSHAHGSFLAYARMLMLADPGGGAPLPARIVDFGCGAGAQLRALSDCGVAAWGVERDPLFAALCDTWFEALPAAAPLWSAGARARIVHGRFAEDPSVARVLPRRVGLVLAKNVLKPGCLRSGPRGKAPLTDFGVSTGRFLAAVRGLLQPGGVIAIYNVFPRASPRLPWTEAGPPFTRRAWRRAAFDLDAVEVDDTDIARAMARALRWRNAREVRATYTLARAAS